MITRTIRAVLAAVVLVWAVQDLTGSIGLGALAALLPLGLGIPNYMPFAVVALPAIAAGAAIAARFWPELALDAAADALRDNAEQLRAALAAQMRG